MNAAKNEITILLDKVRNGDKEAENLLYELVHPHLRMLARQVLGGETRKTLPQPTELVSQVYVRLAGAKLSLRDRKHFYAIAFRAMRREIIDMIRGEKMPMLPIEFVPDGKLARSSRVEVAILVDQLLDKMGEELGQESVAIVEMKYFFSMTDEETAEALGLELRTMQLRWQSARIWLFEKMEGKPWQAKPAKKKAAAK